MSGENQRSARPQIGGRGGFGGGGPMGMAMPAEKPKNFKGSLRRLFSYLTPLKFQLTAVIIMAVISTLFSIVTPKILGGATTKLFEGVMQKWNHIPGAKIDFAFILNIIVTAGVFYILSAIFSFLMQYIMAGASQKIVYHMRMDVNDKLNRLPLKFYDSRTHGEILSRVTNDIDNISSTLQQSMTQLITSLCTLVGVVVMMISINVWLTLICVITIPLSIVVTANIAKVSQKNFAAQQKELGRLYGHIEEMYTGHKIVKAFGHETRAIGDFVEVNEKLYQAAWKAQFVSGIIMPLMGFMNNIGYVLVCVFGGIFVTQKAIAIGDIQAFIQYARQFSMPITQTASIVNVLQSTIASAERVFEILDESEEIPDNPDSPVIESPKGEVRFRNVRFGYNQDVILMEDMNIDVMPGQTIAIVGPTGAGKTTLVNLLMRFYDISSGKITIDGLNIESLKRGDLRRLFGMVLQDTWLFNGTIRDNIAYCRPDATDEDVTRAAKAAHADHFIRALPDGYNTILSEDASNISQGEKQLLTIARAIIADPAILILDEATSSVDTRTEVYIQKAMASLRQGRTSFVIAHRLSTIRDAELILVMNNGRIIEKGNHNELLAKGGFYTDLYNSQFSGAYVEEEIA